MAPTAVLAQTLAIQITSTCTEPARLQHAAAALGADVEFADLGADAGDVPLAQRRPRPLTATWRCAEPEVDARKFAAALRSELAGMGIVTIRTKIETELTAPTPARYLEQHVRVLVDAAAPAEALTRVAISNGGRVTRTLLTGQGRFADERCITQRWWDVDDVDGAQARFDQLLDDLERRTITVVSVSRERVIHDTNVQLDA